MVQKKVETEAKTRVHSLSNTWPGKKEERYLAAKVNEKTPAASVTKGQPLDTQEPLTSSGDQNQKPDGKNGTWIRQTPPGSHTRTDQQLLKRKQGSRHWATTWMALDNTMLGESSQSQRPLPA